MSDEDPLSEFISFRVLTPDEILQSQNRQTILTPKEKFERIYKHLDKRTRRMRKFHFVAIETSTEIYVFDGEGNEIGHWENSVKNCRIARSLCLDLFLASPSKFGGFMFSGPDYANLSDEEIIEMELLTRKEIEIYRRQKSELVAEEKIYATEHNFKVPKNWKLYCSLCEFEFVSIEQKNFHVCTENWIMFDNQVVCRNFGMEGRIELR